MRADSMTLAVFLSDNFGAFRFAGHRRSRLYQSAFVRKS
jgi:hypothetical protein